MQTYGPRQGSRILPLAKCQIFLEAFFICNINTNLNKNFRTQYFYFSNFCTKQLKKNRKRKMAQGRVPSLTNSQKLCYESDLNLYLKIVKVLIRIFRVDRGQLSHFCRKRQIFLEALFICNNINTNLNKNFHTQLSYQSFKLLFLFFQISARSSLKKFANEQWPKAGPYKPSSVRERRIELIKLLFAYVLLNSLIVSAIVDRSITWVEEEPVKSPRIFFREESLLKTKALKFFK